jgi:hypothetical protein
VVDLASWGVGLSLIVLTIAIHTTAVVVMAFVVEARIRPKFEQPPPPLPRAVVNVVGRIGIVTLVLAVLHGLESLLWAFAYWHLDAVDSFTNASIYALSTMTTFEIPDLTIASRFHMISALESANGVLLFGISTAFLFAVLQVNWQLISRRQTKGSSG